MKAEIITIGDEILIGQIVDTNSAWLGKEFSKIGIGVTHIASVSDDADAITEALLQAENRADIIIITGGLGPTKDDVTKQTLADYFQTKLVENPKVKDWITKIFTNRKLPLIEANLQQAFVPESCEVLFNRNGTAPGMWFDKGNKTIISMPGVPFEMKSIFSEECLHRLQKKYALPFILHRTILTCGIGESFLAQKIETFENELPDFFKLAYLPDVGMVKLRLSAQHTDEQFLNQRMDNQVKKLYSLVSEYIYGENEETLAGNVGKLLIKHKQTLATAESCTGGYVAHLITSIPGSSAYYLGSIISYANEIKTNELHVSEDLLLEKGAVSEECVKQMAENIRKKFKTNYAIATSGIAGPTGGSPDKPVGTVWIAVSTPTDTVTKLFNMGDNRERTIQRTAIQALDLLRKELVKL